MPADAPDVARQVLARLQSWWPGRPGDPFAHRGWQTLQGWLAHEMAEATENDHLVVLEQVGLTGLPWHAMNAPWTTSYAPSWSALLDLPQDRKPFRGVGLATVAARADAASTLDAFAWAATSIRACAARHGVTVDVVDGPDADATEIRRLLRDADVVTILSHGLIDPEQRELALLVARDGLLPTQHPIAAASAEGRAHRLTWQSLQNLDDVAGVVLSGACSTGQGLVAGMGERLGLFGALRSAGTRAVVAPAWDAVASDVPAQLARICDLILDGVPLARAIRDTGDELAGELPAWRRRVLCVEGDWR
jgi:CHAT domain-containing protein